ncbi:MAG: TetR/AcrR family transcriptional regulator [Marinoscillum sp.]
MNTKEKILAEGLKLFNKDGVENVTTRHIASEIGISQGNLHYHFPNKNEIILALFDGLMEQLMAARRHNSAEVFRKEEVLESMKQNFLIMQSYRFLFKDNEVVWRRLPAIRKKMIALLDQKKLEIKSIIAEYVRHGIFREDISQVQIDFLADQFIFTISSWLTASEYLGVGNKASYFAVYTFRQWLPYLTQDEMKKWEEML